VPVNEEEFPPDASAQLANRAHSLPHSSLKRLFATYLSLSKPRLTFLMVLTTASAYSLYPVPSLLSSTVTESPSLSALTLVYLTVGTGLCSAAANSLNMIMEPEHDAKMSRTRNRPLVRGLISKRGAILFAIATGIFGVYGLYLGVNPTVSFLGALNIFLYAGVYTPLKRVSVVNTWIGAVVGGIPPLMGWAAGAGQSATGVGDWKELLFGPDAAGGWLLATLLFAWQFHHFNALSWTVRNEYKYAGYRMLAWVDEAMNARVALRYALVCFPACWGLSYVGVTDWGFVLTSSIVNAWICQAAWRFYKFKGAKGSARSLFWVGVWQLPSLLVLAMAQKKGLWSGLKTRYFGDDSFADEDVAFDDKE
jgi:protoheme IX farnesyltransferase